MYSRLKQVLNFIETDIPLSGHMGLGQSDALAANRGNAIGRHYAAMIREKMGSLGLSKWRLDSALSLGSNADKSAPNQYKRQVVRACMLAQMTIRGRPLSEADAIRGELLALGDTGSLQRKFRSHMPSVMVAQGREAWKPELFTVPATLPPFTALHMLVRPAVVMRDGRTAPYKFLISSLPPESGAATLVDLDGTVKKWHAVSASVITQGNSIIYGNVGLILSCPAMGILTASGSDQQFANHTGTARNRKGAQLGPDKPQNDGRLAEEIQRKFFEVNDLFDQSPMKLMSPDEVIAHTKLDKALASAVPTGWNEVTVAGPLLSIAGVFLKLKRDGSLKTNAQGAPLVPADTLLAVRRCAQARRIPIVGLLDSREPA